MKTDAQVRTLCREFAATGKVSVAALRADMCRQTGSTWLRRGTLPSDSRTSRTWRTRPDPFVGVDGEIDALLEKAPGIRGTDVLRCLQLGYAGEYPDKYLRTLQRRLRQKRAQSQPKELFFEQEKHPGEWLQVDWADMNAMGLTIAGEPFAHKICHGVFAFSSVEHVSVCESESFASLEWKPWGHELYPACVFVSRFSAVSELVDPSLFKVQVS